VYANSCGVDNVRHNRFRIGRNTADVDFAQDIAIGTIFPFSAEQKIAIPQNWKILGLDLQQSLRCRQPFIL